jgi:hypothetical protein
MKRFACRFSLAVAAAAIAAVPMAGAARAQAADVRRPAPLLADDPGGGATAGPAGPVDVARQLPADQAARPAAPSAALGAEIERLIEQLGAEEFKARDAAATRLREIGADALGPLTAAKQSPDPEIASRAAGIVRQISRKPSLFDRTGRAPGAAGQRVQVTVGPNGVQTHVFEGDRRIGISEGPGEIRVTVSETEDGKSVTETVTARTLDELRDKSPEAAAVYERWGANGRAAGGGFQVQGGMVRVQGAGPLIIRGGRVAGADVRLRLNAAGGNALAADPLAALWQNAQRRMIGLKVPADRQAEVQKRIQELTVLQETPLADTVAGRNEQARAYNQKCDELRKLFAALNLPDPGVSLPPPAQSRLGITVGIEGAEGVTVGAVLPRTRAERIGLKPGDVIRRVNDKPMTSAQDLRQAVTESDKLVLFVARDGKETKLEEPPAPPPPATKPAALKP